MFYVPGDKVPEPGIYTVTHDPRHARPHAVAICSALGIPWFGTKKHVFS